MMETKEAKDSREKKRRRTIKTQNQTESRSSSPDSNKKLRGESKQVDFTQTVIYNSLCKARSSSLKGHLK